MNQDAQAPEQVGDLMTADLTSIQSTERIGDARDLLVSRGIHALPVMSGDDVVGILTSSDLVDNWPEEDPINGIMTPSPMSIAIDAPLSEAAGLMVAERIHHLIVSDGDKVAGIISSFDLLKALAD